MPWYSLKQEHNYTTHAYAGMLIFILPWNIFATLQDGHVASEINLPYHVCTCGHDNFHHTMKKLLLTLRDGVVRDRAGAQLPYLPRGPLAVVVLETQQEVSGEKEAERPRDVLGRLNGGGHHVRQVRREKVNLCFKTARKKKKERREKKKKENQKRDERAKKTQDKASKNSYDSRKEKGGKKEGQSKVSLRCAGGNTYWSGG